MFYKAYTTIKHHHYSLIRMVMIYVAFLMVFSLCLGQQHFLSHEASVASCFDVYVLDVLGKPIQLPKKYRFIL